MRKIIKLRSINQRGEGESSLIFTLIGAGIAVSLIYFGVQWVLQTKEERRHLGQKEVIKPAPKSIDDVGGYEAEVHPLL